MMENQIIGIIGGRGTGKTLLAISKAYAQYLKGRRVYTNLHACSDQIGFKSQSGLNWSTYITREQFAALRESDAVVLLDEVYVFFDARGSGGNKEQAKKTYAITQSRKHGFDLIYTLVRLKDVDTRVRTNTDILYVARDSNKGILESGSGETIRFDRIVPEPSSVRTLTGYRPLFDIYNTKEVVGEEKDE